jgi:hypothetical protein
VPNDDEVDWEDWDAVSDMQMRRGDFANIRNRRPIIVPPPEFVDWTSEEEDLAHPINIHPRK